MKEVKNLGTTSFIIPNNRVENVKYLCDKVDFVQLLFLEKFSLKEDILEIMPLSQLKKDRNIDYIIHLPIDFDFKRDIFLVHDFLDFLNPLCPQSFILHPENNNLFFQHLANIIQRYNISIENLDDISFFDGIFEMGCNLCLDIGHAIIHGIDVKTFINTYGDKIDTLHLHGMYDYIDHKSLRYIDKNILLYLLDFSIEKDTINIIEVFNEKDFLDSINYLKEVFKQHGYTYHRWD